MAGVFDTDAVTLDRAAAGVLGLAACLTVTGEKSPFETSSARWSFVLVLADRRSLSSLMTEAFESLLEAPVLTLTDFSVGRFRTVVFWAGTDAVALGAKDFSAALAFK